MGTSQSSTGPGAGVSLVPPWAEGSLAPSGAEGQSQDGSELDDQQPLPSVEQSDLAPPRRFMSTRRHLGHFAKTGDKHSLQAGVGHYISSGYGVPRPSRVVWREPPTRPGVSGASLTLRSRERRLTALCFRAARPTRSWMRSSKRSALMTAPRTPSRVGRRQIGRGAHRPPNPLPL